MMAWCTYPRSLVLRTGDFVSRFTIDFSVGWLVGAWQVTDGWPVTIDEITVFGSILHMHQTGDMMYTETTWGGATEGGIDVWSRPAY